ncbi:RNA polymerase I associated factor, A49-like protein [Basidiobolus meristosporus CBS 931.73]|uniref:RNA polymerase I associated factor, A49-like protein n=1 Tax=Basidiobolus meristosporus CBS 931.73 TaxID=1314790 RepID=A0A1Y1YSL9_9FUNG|nr:RNA polymerase I associated factor, A49-like protein [Basidiobolus meristosporus CBS 931.73]|eukprot:ORY00824.1 RNA polymerase I associated factor, A49-like protein [Basidiobolus meristosporus CBS 931.73]
MSAGKRKREESGAEKLPLKLDSSDSGAPVLVTFPGVYPSNPQQQFQLYKNTVSRRSNQVVIAGETERVEFVGQNFGEEGPKNLYCKYMVGVYDKKTNSVTFKEAPVCKMTRHVKALKHLQAQQSDNSQVMVALNALGEAFGSKRRKAQIRAVERNRVDVGNLQDAASYIKDNLEEHANSVPTQDDIKNETDADRPIPPYNLEATEAKDIYNYNDIISPAEVSVLPFTPLLKTEAEGERIKLLPFRNSAYIKERLSLAVQKKDRFRVKNLLYISYLMQFRNMRERQLNDPEAFAKMLNDPPSIIAEKLLERFTEVVPGPNGKPSYRITPKCQDKVTCYIMALALILDDFVAYPAVFAKDLSISQSKAVELFKNLGCRVDNISKAEQTALGLTASDIKRMKKVRLVAPLTFPEKKFRRSK